MDPEADSAQTRGDQDVEMAHTDTYNGPEEPSQSRTPAQQDTSTTAGAIPSRAGPNGSQEEGVPSITMTEGMLDPQREQLLCLNLTLFAQSLNYLNP